MRTEELNTSLANNMSPTHRKTLATHKGANPLPGEYCNTSAAVVGGTQGNLPLGQR